MGQGLAQRPFLAGFGTTLTVHYLVNGNRPFEKVPDEAERLGLEQAIAYFMQMRQTAQTAPDGTVLAVCEQVALIEGRFLRNRLAAAVQSRIDEAEQKGERPGAAEVSNRPSSDC